MRSWEGGPRDGISALVGRWRNRNFLLWKGGQLHAWRRTFMFSLAQDLGTSQYRLGPQALAVESEWWQVYQGKGQEHRAPGRRVRAQYSSVAETLPPERSPWKECVTAFRSSTVLNMEERGDWSGLEGQPYFFQRKILFILQHILISEVVMLKTHVFKSVLSMTCPIVGRGE